MPWEKGQSGNPEGRRKGVANRVLTNALKEILEVGKDSGKLDRMLHELVGVAMDREHKDFIAAQRLVMSRLQAELKHEMTEDEAKNAGTLLEALMGLTGATNPRPSDEMEDAAE